ncbi:DNA-binding transcriptional MerR regulator [Fontibacillus phaseoli]|uniref:DNA-binding transcriptional MerR regulator n=1 Tax=Fontibacillus phaseoli TaxID=1416533 RepID=A0A369B8U4_9BACL|nr:MerR family transcriptional regulator [Fontibacillus phaseoli]RCX16957.1 DNA-binding transcriptional MerR regulator [Fontibacillus phaseoli]
MEYTVQKLGRLAGISTRTLRYYDEIGILKPARMSSSGYRIYGQAEVDRLQQILFYRELDFPLEQIKAIVTNPRFDGTRALIEHRERLLDRKKQLDALIANVDRTIAMNEGRITMSDKEKFDGFKQKLIDENEEKYGTEIREKYGNETVDKSNAKLKHMTEAEYEKVQTLEKEMFAALEEGMQSGDPAGASAQEAANMHRQWLTFYWDQYSKDAHAGLAQMYVADERFKAYYDDRARPGAAEFLRDAILIYTGAEN